MLTDGFILLIMVYGFKQVKKKKKKVDFWSGF